MSVHQPWFYLRMRFLTLDSQIFERRTVNPKSWLVNFFSILIQTVNRRHSWWLVSRRRTHFSWEIADEKKKKQTSANLCSQEKKTLTVGCNRQAQIFVDEKMPGDPKINIHPMVNRQPKEKKEKLLSVDGHRHAIPKSENKSWIACWLQRL